MKAIDKSIGPAPELPRIIGDDVESVGRKILGALNFRVEVGDSNT